MRRRNTVRRQHGLNARRVGQVSHCVEQGTIDALTVERR
jgi:hypothetical protein